VKVPAGSPLARLGIGLRAEGDAAFLLALFASVRGPEFRAAGLPEEA
jgi:hypothetical protein